jgi:hypothetical protein
MLGALTVRKLKPGTFDDFRKAWEPEEWPPGFVRAYHVRSLEDEDTVVSFGLLDGSPDDLGQMRDDPNFRRVEDERQRRMAEYVESTGVDGIFEVVDEVTPAGG